MKLLLLTKSRTLVFVLFNVFLGFTLQASTYYVSSTGNDSYSASQAKNQSTPWKTIARLNQITLVKGDVVLFKRGGVYRGQVRAISGVTYGAYGTGNYPIISGAAPVTKWSLYKGKIYVATVSSPVKGVIVNGKAMTLARFPNKDYLYIDSSPATNTFKDAAITKPSGYWVGANVRVTLRDWLNGVGKVTSHSGTTIKYSSSSTTSILKGYTYYFENKLSELDVAKEWYYSPTSKKLYLYAPGGVNPSTLKVEVIVSDYGFKGAGSNTSGVTIKDLQIEKQSFDGVYLYQGSGANNTVINNRFYLQGENGISFMGNNMKIENNIFADIDGRGIVGNVSIGSSIQKNTFKRIGLRPGYGINTTTNYRSTAGIILGSKTSKFKIAYNKMDSMGYMAIRPDGTYHLIEKNIIKYSMLTHSDGAAIYAWGDITHHLTIKDNFIMYVKGVTRGKPGGLAYGIYLDVKVHHSSIIHNTIIGSDYGAILLNAGNKYNVVRNNVCYGNKLSSIKLDDWLSSYPVSNNVVTKNVFYATSPSSTILYLDSKYKRYNFGRYDSNYYANPYSDFPIKRNADFFSLTQWKSMSGQDARTKKSLYSWTLCEVSEVTSGNKIPNGTFNSSVTGWTYWNKNNSRYQFISSGLDGGSLKYTMTSNVSPGNGFVSSPTFSAVQNQNYELKFSAKSTKSGKVTVIVRQAHSPYGTIYVKEFPLTTSRNNYNHVFKMPVSDSKLRLDFQIFYSNSTLTLDNVSLKSVKVTCHNPADRSRIFTNPTGNTMSVGLSKSYKDLNGNTVSGSIKIAPWSSVVLVSAVSSTRLAVAKMAEPEESATENSKLVIYPNPARGDVFVTGIKEIENIKILNTQGVAEFKADGINSFEYKADVSNMGVGVYILEVNYTSREVERKKLIIRD